MNAIFKRKSIRKFLDKEIEDEKIESLLKAGMGACTRNILLQAVEEGLGGVWLGTYPDEERVNYLKKHFNIPENVYPYSVIVLGYPTEDYTGTDRFDESRIHYESY